MGKRAVLVAAFLPVWWTALTPAATPPEVPSTQSSGGIDQATQVEFAERLVTLASESLRQGRLPDAAWRRGAELLATAQRLNPQEPRYPRLRALALEHVGDVDATIAALNSYLAIAPGDKVAQAKLIALNLGKLESADEKLKYANKLLDLKSLAPEVKSFVASLAVPLLMERSADDAARMAERAVKLYPLPEATRQYYELIGSKKPLKERIAALLAMLDSNPNQPQVIAEVGRQLALNGLSDPSLQWLYLAITLFSRSPAQPPDFHRLLTDYASLLFISGRVQAADSFTGQLLDRFPDDADAWFLKLVVIRAASEQVAYEQNLELAKDALITRWNEVAALVLQNPAATQPATRPGAEPAAVEPTDPTPVVQKLKSVNDARATAGVESVLGDLAWFELYFDKKPDRATKWIDVLKSVLPEDSVTLARLQGWLDLQSNKPGEAREALSKVADRDPLSKLGLIKLDETEKKPADAEAARQLLTQNRMGWEAALLWDAVKTEQTRPASQPFDEVRQELDAFAQSRWLDVLDPAKAPQFYSVNVVMIRPHVPFGEPALAVATVKNHSPHAITIGPNSTVRPDLLFNQQIVGVNQMSFPAAAYDQIANELVLRGGVSTQQVVRLDQGDLHAVLSQLPSANTRVNGVVVTNPLTSQDGIFPGAAGVMMKIGGYSYEGINLNTPVANKRIQATMSNGPAAEKLYVLDLLAGYVRVLSRTDAASRAQALSLFKLIENAQHDGSPFVSAWSTFLRIQFNNGDERDKLIVSMTQSPDWLSRLLGLVAAGQMPADKMREVAAPLAQNDPDPNVKAYAAATLQLAQSPAGTQPSGQPAQPELAPAGG